MNRYFFILLALVLFPFHEGHAEENEIFITISSSMDEIIFDGKWSFFPEWKSSSLEIIGNDLVMIRAAHQDEFVYVFLDSLIDETYDKGSDKAMICFDTKNNKSVKPDMDDYCFVAVMGTSNGHVLQGGSNFATNGYLQKINTPYETIMIGGVSDINDRYSKIPHMSYEFKIPTHLIDRSNEYGFYVQVYDASANEFQTWPENIKQEFLKTPSPQTWGSLISIDNSLPEFPAPIILILILFSLIVLFTRKNFNPLVNKITKN